MVIIILIIAFPKIHLQLSTPNAVLKKTWPGTLVEGVLVLHSSCPTSPVGVVVVVGRTAGGLQQALGAVAPAL